MQMKFHPGVSLILSRFCSNFIPILMHFFKFHPDEMDVFIKMDEFVYLDKPTLFIWINGTLLSG